MVFDNAKYFSSLNIVEFDLKTISISNIQLTISRREMEWLNLPTRIYFELSRKPSPRINGIDIMHWTLLSGLIE